MCTWVWYDFKFQSLFSVGVTEISWNIFFCLEKNEIIYPRQPERKDYNGRNTPTNEEGEDKKCNGQSCFGPVDGAPTEVKQIMLFIKIIFKKYFNSFRKQQQQSNVILG